MVTALIAGLFCYGPALSFSEPADQVSDRMATVLGEALFSKLWVASPSSTTASDGLGPLYNARACSACHPRAGAGAALPDAGGEAPDSLLVRFGNGVDPLVSAFNGVQLQHRATAGLPAEGRIELSWSGQTVELDDGSVVQLRKPAHRVHLRRPEMTLAYAQLKFRQAPTLAGSGAFARVPLSALEALADPDDQNGDGISGRLSLLPDGQIGRYGWRALEPTLSAQNSRAFNLDMGMSTAALPDPHGDCGADNRACRALPSGDDPVNKETEVTVQMHAWLDRYVAQLPPPSGRAEAASASGRALFRTTGCQACHRLDLPLDTGGTLAAGTDLLLHDLGPALADADGREWRTAPLWGASARPALLHDGRARTIIEAILWHGGEAQAAQQAFRGLSASQRSQLLSYLESL
ncbi:di-heme oxidoredictase family protein [Granulosicoccaceae sp. 1_MG-2023]|nr:di-heme oxidoredictase family protein [Granulosicoccaceae sp. 1_MG-2023]